MIEKECEICGKYFMAKTPRRRYCDDCQHNAGRKRIYMQRNIRASQMRCGDYIQTSTCSECGKEFKGNSIFCSSDCRQAHKLKNKVCAWCGQKLGPELAELTYHPECLEKKEKQYALLWTDICPGCGKEFINPEHKRKYCSKACAVKGQKQPALTAGFVTCSQCGRFYNPKHRQSFKGKDAYGQQVYLCSQECLDGYRKKTSDGQPATCCICNRDFRVKKGERIFARKEDGKLHICCSERCLTEDRRRAAVRKAVSQEAAHRNNLEVEKILAIQKPKKTCKLCSKTFPDRPWESQEYCENCRKILKNGLCCECKTLYADCQYSASGYVTYPKGCVRKDGKIIACPDYSGNKTNGD